MDVDERTGVKTPGIAHLLLGSVAERSVRTAPCPVLVIRHPEHEFVRADALEKTR